MSALEQIRAMYEYDAWANGHVLDAASRLGDEELARELGASFGSVAGNLLHTVQAQVLWHGRWTGTEPASIINEEGPVTLASLRHAYEASHAALRAFVASLNEGDTDRTVAYVDTRGVEQERVLWQTLLQIAHHGTHHRAETALLLTSLGQPPRQLDYIFFEIERAGGAPRLD